MFFGIQGGWEEKQANKEAAGAMCMHATSCVRAHVLPLSPSPPPLPYPHNLAPFFPPQTCPPIHWAHGPMGQYPYVVTLIKMEGGGEGVLGRQRQGPFPIPSPPPPGVRDLHSSARS